MARRTACTRSAIAARRTALTTMRKLLARHGEDHRFLRQQHVGEQRLAGLEQLLLQVLDRHRARVGELHEARIVAPQLLLGADQVDRGLRDLRVELRHARRGVGERDRHGGAAVAQLREALLQLLAALAQADEGRLAGEARHVGLAHQLGEHAALVARGDGQRLAVVARRGLRAVQLQQDADGLAVDVPRTAAGTCARVSSE